MVVVSRVLFAGAVVVVLSRKMVTGLGVGIASLQGFAGAVIVVLSRKVVTFARGLGVGIASLQGFAGAVVVVLSRKMVTFARGLGVGVASLQGFARAILRKTMLLASVATALVPALVLEPNGMVRNDFVQVDLHTIRDRRRVRQPQEFLEAKLRLGSDLHKVLDHLVAPSALRPVEALARLLHHGKRLSLRRCQRALLASKQSLDKFGAGTARRVVARNVSLDVVSGVACLEVGKVLAG